MRHCAAVAAAVVLVAGAGLAYVNYEYYEGTWDALPDFDALTPKHTGLAFGFDISQRDRDDNFGFRFRAYIDIPREGAYTFYTTSDDGSKLYINGALVVNNDGLHGSQERGGSVSLTPGRHLIEVTYFEKGGDNVLYVQYEGPEIEKGAIPDEVLSPVTVPATVNACCPVPYDGSVAVDPGAVLRWLAPDPGLVPAPEYDVYFGEDPNFPEGARVAGGGQAAFDPFDGEDMAAGMTYYWRVDVFDPNEGGSPALHTGEVWSFVTRRGLVALYEFETGPDDVTGHGYDGVYVGSAEPNIVPDSLRGNVLELNPGGQADGQYVKVDPVGISGRQPRTIAGWARAATLSLPDWTGVFGFAPKAGTTNNYFDVQRDNAGNYALHVHGWEQPFRPLDTQWHHFAATYDGMTIRWYLDGEPVGSMVRALATIDEFRIGSRQSHGTYFVGWVDDVAIWDYALSSEDIRRMVLFCDFDADGQVDTDDLKTFAEHWLADTVVPGSIMPTVVLEDFEVYGAFPPISLGWFVYLHDSGKYGNPPSKPYPGSIATGEPGPYGGQQAFKVHYEFPVYDGDDWLTLGHRLSPYPDVSEYDEIRFRIRYHADNTEDVLLVFHAANDPPDVTEHEAFNVGPFSTMDDPADPNQWHEIVIGLRDNPMIDWQGSYGSIDDVHHMNGILVSIVNTSREVRTGTLYFDDFRLIDYTPDCEGLPPVDLNADCVVDLRDFAILAEEWLRRV